MPIYLGNTEVSRVYRAGVELSQAYRGNTAGGVELIPAAPTYPLTLSYLLIGGGGGASYGGGGGAGGYRNSYASETSGANSATETPLTVNSGGNLCIQIGAGGAGVYQGASAPGKGSSSRIGSLYAQGGGAGARSVTDSGIVDGGSGGGEGFTDTTDSPGSYRGAGTSNQGTRGGNGQDYLSNSQFAGEWYMGGGGGAGSNTNVDSVWNSRAGNGGNGLSSSITGTAVTRAGGGGGATWSASGAVGTGGTGGGGNATRGTNSTGGSGTTNSGSGGGASGSTSQSQSNTGTGGSGGSGVAILRYPKNGVTLSVGAGLTYTETTVGDDNVVTITAGAGTVTFN